MVDIPLRRLETSIEEPALRPRANGRLRIAAKPHPFVAPTLRLASEDQTIDSALAAEVILIRAPAAVGKSVMASYLSFSRKLPLLNLADVPVSTNSLVGLIQSDIEGAGDAIDHFHLARLTVVIDALDEGRLLSGEQGFEGFLETTGELLLRDRRVINRPKLILLGRHESVEFANLGIKMADAGILVSSVELGFFDESSAWEMIKLYATTLAKPDAAYFTHPEPVNELIRAYFAAMEAALGLQVGELWNSDKGRSFAGYAPVLAALGSLIAVMDQFKIVENRLRSSGTHEAWGVIDTVLKEILLRERTKLSDKLAVQIASDIPPETYDIGEQLRFLVDYLHNRRDLLPKLPSFIRRVCSGYAPVWGVLQTPSV